MKTRIAIIAGICTIALISFAFSTLDNKSIDAHSSKVSSQSAPAGGFAAEEIKR